MTVGWIELKDRDLKLMLKWLNNYHCAYNSEIGTCITNDTGRPAALKINENTRFWSNLVKRRFILMFSRYILTFKLLNKIPNLQVLSLKTFFSFIKGGRLYLLLVLEMDSQCWGRTRKLIINLK